MESVRIKALQCHAEFEACVQSREEAWLHENLDLIPVHHYFSGGDLFDDLSSSDRSLYDLKKERTKR